MKARKMLWAVRKGAEDWQEEIITTDASKIDAARKWAEANGFDRFRVAEYDDSPLDFAKTVNKL